MGVRRARSARRTPIFGNFPDFLEFSGIFFPYNTVHRSHKMLCVDRLGFVGYVLARRERFLGRFFGQTDKPERKPADHTKCYASPTSDRLYLLSESSKELITNAQGGFAASSVSPLLTSANKYTPIFALTSARLPRFFIFWWPTGHQNLKNRGKRARYYKYHFCGSYFGKFSEIF